MSIITKILRFVERLGQCLWHTGKMSLAAVIFDYGKVISYDQDGHYLTQMRRLSGLDQETFERLYWQYRDDYDAGVLNGAGYWQAIGKGAGLEFTPSLIQDLIRTDNLSWSRTHDLALRWATELSAAGYKIGILSNMHEDLRVHLQEHATWLKSFDHAVFSCDVGMVKPQTEIYGHVVSGLGVAAAECLFLDDREVNIKAARAAGWQGILVHDLREAMREASARFGLPVASLSAAA